jgi:hypothetical protein
MACCLRFVLLLAVFFGCAGAGRAGPAEAVRDPAKLDDWTTVKNARHGFAIGYPTMLFDQKSPSRTTDEGRIFESKDGRAKLLVGAFANETGYSLEDYSRYLLSEQFAAADIDYVFRQQHWFVISGTWNGSIFYQRVSFTCGGKLINSWAMIYPVSERRFYDRLVEAIAQTFTPGAGRTGACD